MDYFAVNILSYLSSLDNIHRLFHTLHRKNRQPLNFLLREGLIKSEF